MHYTRCTLLTRWSIYVLKVDVLYGGEVFKHRLVHSVAVAIAALNNFVQLLLLIY